MSDLLVDRDGPVRRLTLNRPAKANALNADLVEALIAEVEAAHTDGTRLLVLQGEGKNFCAGFDLTGYEAASEGELLLRFVRIEQLLQAAYHAPFVTLALAHGPTLGAGADLFLACEVRVASPDATFRMPGLRFGLQLGTRRLSYRIGGEAARRILADSRSIGADEALALRFAHRIARHEEWPLEIEAEFSRATVLSPEARARLNGATVPDSRAQDMADLVASLAVPNLKARIRQYRERG